MQMIQDIWQRPSTFVLAPRQVHVWTAALAVPMAVVGDLSEQLAADEQARASQLQRPQDRRDFVLRRVMLRKLLSRYLGCEMKDVALDASASGKLRLRDDASGLEFNISSSDGRAVFAIARSVQVGIDLERIRPDFDHRDLSERYFSEPERAQLARKPAEFFRLWTRKEARVKLSGQGLLQPEDDSAAAANFVEIPAGDGYCACLATSQPGLDVELIRWAIPGVHWPLKN